MFISKLDPLARKNLVSMAQTLYGKVCSESGIKPISRLLSVDSGFTSIGTDSSIGAADKLYYGYFNGSFEMKTLYDTLTIRTDAKSVLYKSQVNVGYPGPVWMPFETKPVLFNYAALSVQPTGTISSSFLFVGFELNLG